MATLLSAAELARAGRLSPSAVAPRAGLRTLLGQLCDGRSPERVPLQIDARGKPFPSDDVAPGVPFNIAHSEGLIACAVTLGHAVGIDIEREQEGRDPDAIAGYCFAPEEARALRRLPAALRRRAFYTAWTRKEAVLKANGDGLVRGLDSVVVSVRPDDAAILAADPALGPPGGMDAAPSAPPRGVPGLGGGAEAARHVACDAVARAPGLMPLTTGSDPAATRRGRLRDPGQGPRRAVR